MADDFHAVRARGIGASEAAAAAGLSPWKSRYRLYLEKRGEAPPVDQTEEMEFGTIVEPSIARLYERRHGVTLRYPLPTCTHPEFPFVIASGDAEESAEVGVELKSMHYQRAKQVDELGLAAIVPEYLCQAQQQMAVMGWQVVKLVALVERKLRVWEVPRDAELIEMLIGRERELWDRIQRGDPPPIDVTSASALEDLKWKSRGKVRGEYVRLSPAAAEAWKRRSAIKAQIKALEEQSDAELAAVLQEIGDYGGGVLPGDAKVVKRIAVAGGHVSYERKPSVQTRECNWSNGTIVRTEVGTLASDEADEQVDVYAVADARLRQSGFLCNFSSEHGSRYYVHGVHSVRVRVSDHKPNQKTQEWMKRNDVFNVRVDQEPLVALATVTCVLEEIERLNNE